MRTPLLISIILFFIISNNKGLAQVELEFPVFAEGLNSPVSMAHAGDDRLFIVQRPGQISIVDAGGDVLPESFLNLQNRILSGSERGLLGLAFHPDYTENGYFFVNYTRTGDGATIVSRFSVSSENPDKGDPDSELILLTIAQPFSNHNGGGLNFGADGYLYIGMGDGGSGGDPQNYSQNPLTMLGKMLRIDVDNGSPYSIPEDNPFVGTDSHLDEIYALGLRNPWRFSFDTENGDLWIADVGQNAWEEINHQKGGTAGGQNYGWRCYEGFQEFNTNGCDDISAYTMPVAVYGRGDGCSVSGGVVYRGSSIPDLAGAYLYTDYCTDNIWTITIDEEGNYSNEIITGSGINNSTGIFAGADNELYIISIGGRVHKIVSSGGCNLEVSISTDGNGICEGESVQLEVTTNINNPTVFLFFNGSVIEEGGLVFELTQAGEYFVRIEGEGCHIDSEPVNIIEKELSNATFADLPSDISENEDPITLVPQIEGGLFSGPGVIGNSFDPSVAGIGIHTITYTLTEEDKCENQYSREIEVLMSTASHSVNTEDITIIIKPNPVTGSVLQIDFSSGETRNFNMEIIDLNGKIVRKYPAFYYTAGSGIRTFELEIGSVPSGVYMIKLANGTYQHTERFVRK